MRCTATTRYSYYGYDDCAIAAAASIIFTVDTYIAMAG